MPSDSVIDYEFKVDVFASTFFFAYKQVDFRYALP
jgi:hypothetical protein